MLPQPGKFEHIAHDFVEVDTLPTLSQTSVTYLAGLEHLLHRTKQAIRVLNHDAIEISALRFDQWSALKRLQIQPN